MVPLKKWTEQILSEEKCLPFMQKIISTDDDFITLENIGALLLIFVT